MRIASQTLEAGHPGYVYIPFRSFNQTSKSTNKHSIQATRMLEVQWLAFAGKFLCDLSGKKAKVWGSKLYQADLLKFTGKPDQCTMLVKFCQGLFISLMVGFPSALAEVFNLASNYARSWRHRKYAARRQLPNVVRECWADQIFCPWPRSIDNRGSFPLKQSHCHGLSLSVSGCKKWDKTDNSDHPWIAAYESLVFSYSFMFRDFWN